MELEKSNDIKMELLKRTAKHRQELENEVRLISERTQNILTSALIIGGTLAAAYFIIRQLSGSSTPKKKRSKHLNVLPPKLKERIAPVDEETSPGMVSQIGTALASQATIFLLGLAKEKLSEYLKSPSDKKEKDEHP